MKDIKSLYIHIPFCESICSYCDFIKILSNTNFQDKYIEALIDEIESYKIQDNTLDTIYIGGGTPTVLSLKQLNKILDYLYIHFKNVKEFTIEANPESLSIDKIKSLSLHKVNRVSIGVQSTNSNILKAMNRSHTNQMVIDCVNNLRKNKITNINLDFIYGYPDQTIEDVKNDISFINSLNPTHLSFYSLQIEPNTLIFKTKETNEDILRDMYDLIYSKLTNQGYHRYEVSNYSKIGFESKHNLCYWTCNQYYGVGLSSSGYIKDLRYTNTKSMNKYLNHEYIHEKTILDLDDKEFEFLMLGLRLEKGVSLQEFKKRFNKDFLISYKDQIAKVNEYITIDKDRFFIKKEYLYTMDSILINLLKFK